MTIHQGASTRDLLGNRLPADWEHWATRLQLLVDAYQYARDLDRDVWDFAVEIATLRSAGMSDSDLRWLLCKGYILHRAETTFTGEPKRTFHDLDGLKFAEQSCFVLTEVGFDTFKHDKRLGGLTGLSARNVVKRHIPRTDTAPRWDPDRHSLVLGHQIVKQFKLPAPNQEAVLMAFEEEGWPRAIDDPIPPAPHQDAKQRLRDTIKSLNRNQKNQRIRFSGDGSGQRVLWDLFDAYEKEHE